MKAEKPVPLEVVEKKFDADAALKAFEGLEGRVELDEETRRRLLRKIDLHLMPVGFVCFRMVYCCRIESILRVLMNITDPLYCVRIELSGQDYVELCFYHGAEAETFG